jgi:hypothetical protein
VVWGLEEEGRQFRVSLILLALDSGELDKGLVQAVVQLEDGSQITRSINVVGGREKSEDIVIVSPLVALHNQLVSTDDIIQAVLLAELLGDISTPELTATTVGWCEARAIDRIRPQQVRDRALVTWFCEAVQCANLIKSLQIGGQTAMDAEYPIVDRGGEREEVKHLVHDLPHSGITVCCLALCEKSIELVDASALVVSAQHCDTVGPTELVGQEQGHCLDRVGSTINEITKEEILGLGDGAT